MSSKPLQIKTINPDNVYGESVIYSQPIVSDTQPTIESLGTQLWEGLIWYNPTLNVTKMYINGEFLQINIGSVEYASGNTFSFASTSPSTSLFASGVLTSSLKDIYFNIPLPKNTTYVTPSITALKGNIRCASGYLYPSDYVSGGYDFVGDTTNFAVSISKNSQFPNNLICRINKPTAFTGFTNNQPVNIEINAITISFA